jgi:K+-sensing histidine kinase KdpD
MTRHSGTRDGVVLTGAVLALAAAVGLLHMIPGASPTTAALTLLLVVLATATVGRLMTSSVIAVLGTLALDFFSCHPSALLRSRILRPVMCS